MNLNWSPNTTGVHVRPIWLVRSLLGVGTAPAAVLDYTQGLHWTACNSKRLSCRVVEMQIAFTIGTVLFGLYIATKIWGKQDAQGETWVCMLLWPWLRHVCNLRFLQGLLPPANKHSKEGNNRDGSRTMMTACLMSGLKASLSANKPEKHKTMIPGDTKHGQNCNTSWHHVLPTCTMWVSFASVVQSWEACYNLQALLLQSTRAQGLFQNLTKCSVPPDSVLSWPCYATSLLHPYVLYWLYGHVMLHRLLQFGKTMLINCSIIQACSILPVRPSKSLALFVSVISHSLIQSLYFRWPAPIGVKWACVIE